MSAQRRPNRGVQPINRALLFKAKRLQAAVDAASEALFDIYLHEGPTYGVGITVRPGGTIREKINRFNLAYMETKI